MSWIERDAGERAFRNGESRYGDNPHSSRYGADYDERSNHREWEEGHRYAERRDEERRRDEAAEEQEMRRRLVAAEESEEAREEQEWLEEQAEAEQEAQAEADEADQS